MTPEQVLYACDPLEAIEMYVWEQEWEREEYNRQHNIWLMRLNEEGWGI